jgi:alanine racemase
VGVVAFSRPSWVQVDLEALGWNLSVLKELVAPAKFCAVVKADAYGHGAVEVARKALSSGADWLAVAVLEEGLELREAGVDAPVLLLSEPTGDPRILLEYRLTPSVYSKACIAALDKAAAAGSVKLPVHLKLDTGMHRLGADPRCAGSLAHAIQGSTHLVLEGLWTHLARAGELDAQSVDTQVKLLLGARDVLSASGISPSILHAANSAGAIGFPSARLQMVRCGIALYGCSPFADESVDCSSLEVLSKLRPVASVRSRIMHMRMVEEGEMVSYGYGFKAPRPTLVAVLPIGYADGISRKAFPAGLHVLVRGKPCPIIGNVTMDHVMVDVTDCPGASPGDEVVLIGSQDGCVITAEQWAQAMGTISYEVLSRLGSRLPRVVLGGVG